MALRYEVTGYDRQTGRLAVSYSVPARKLLLSNKSPEFRPLTMGSARTGSA